VRLIGSKAIRQVLAQKEIRFGLRLQRGNGWSGDSHHNAPIMA
jgi:hypothetical protein